MSTESGVTDTPRAGGTEQGPSHIASCVGLHAACQQGVSDLHAVALIWHEGFLICILPIVTTQFQEQNSSFPILCYISSTKLLFLCS